MSTSELAAAIFAKLLAPLRSENELLATHIADQAMLHVTRAAEKPSDEALTETREKLYIEIARALPKAQREGAAYLEEHFTAEELRQTMDLLSGPLWAKLSMLGQIPAIVEFQMAVSSGIMAKATAEMKETMGLLKDEEERIDDLSSKAFKASADAIDTIKEADEKLDELMDLSLGVALGAGTFE